MLNLGSDEWVAVQDLSLLDVWGDADARKGNAFFSSHLYKQGVMGGSSPWPTSFSEAA